MSLIEVMATLALSASLMISTIVVIRSSHAAWESHEEELVPAFSQNAVQRHITKHIRQAIAITSISLASDTTGTLSIQKADGSTFQWDYSLGSVTCSVNGATAEPVADNISTLAFIGYEADGTTTTTAPNDIHSVACQVGIVQPTGGSRTTSTHSWLRSW